LTRLHHVAVGTRDVERLARFYREAFGLREERRRDDEQGLFSIWLDLEGSLLMIERSSEPERRVEGVGSGPFLLAFRVNASERAECESRLEQVGADIETRAEFTTYARDPDGNRIAISHFPETSRVS
jgi:catechol 2,3-dioxygenase-like lactoylglutathione lyase family enzyme